MIFGLNAAFSTQSLWDNLKKKKKLWKVPCCLLVCTVNCENAPDKLFLHTKMKKVSKYANEAVIRLIKRTFKVHIFALRKLFGNEILGK